MPSCTARARAPGVPMPEPSTTDAHLVRFGLFELNLRSGELRKAGTRINLQEQPLRVLTVLLDRPGDLVTRDELRERLWPGDTFVDFDHGLNAVVNRLRDTLGDSADSPRFIETVPRRGLSIHCGCRASSGGTRSERRADSSPTLTSSLIWSPQPDPDSTREVDAAHRRQARTFVGAGVLDTIAHAAAIAVATTVLALSVGRVRCMAAAPTRRRGRWSAQARARSRIWQARRIGRRLLPMASRLPSRGLARSTTTPIST